MQTVTFSDKAVSEVLPYVVTFSDLLQAGETLNGATCIATVYSGTDAAPQNIIDGPATYTATTVTQNITGGLAGVIYIISMLATASNSHNYMKVFYISVVPDSGGI